MTTGPPPPRAVRGIPPQTLTLSVLLVGLAAMAVAGAMRGIAGVSGAGVGVGVVVVFFASTHLVLVRTRRLPAELSLLIALGLYVLKVVLVALTFVLLDTRGLLGISLHREALALTVIACTLTWTFAELAAAVRSREPLYELGPGTTS